MVDRRPFKAALWVVVILALVLGVVACARATPTPTPIKSLRDFAATVSFTPGVSPTPMPTRTGTPTPGKPPTGPGATRTPRTTPTPYLQSAGVHTPEDLRQFVDGWPKDYKLVINEDAIVLFTHPERVWPSAGLVVLFIYPEPVAAASIWHIPSMSAVHLRSNGEVGRYSRREGRDYKSEEGAAALEAVLADEGLMQRIRTRIEELFEGW